MDTIYFKFWNRQSILYCNYNCMHLCLRSKSLPMHTVFSSECPSHPQHTTSHPRRRDKNALLEENLLNKLAQEARTQILEDANIIRKGLNEFVTGCVYRTLLLTQRLSLAASWGSPSICYEDISGQQLQQPFFCPVWRQSFLSWDKEKHVY